MTVEESVHIVFDEVDHRNIQIPKTRAEEDGQSISLEKQEICAEKQLVDSQKQLIEILQQSELPKEWSIPRDLSVENIIGKKKEGVSTRSSISNFCRHTTFISQIEPKSICIFLSFSLRNSSILLFIYVWLSSSSYASFHIFYFRTFIIIITILVFTFYPLELHLHTYLTTWLSLCPVGILFGFLTS